MTTPEFKERIEREKRYIADTGYALRVFEENNNVKASWGYTVGLRLNGPGPFSLDTTHPVCLFARFGTGGDIVDRLLCEAAERAMASGVVANADIECSEIDTVSGVKAHYRFVMVDKRMIEAARDLFGNVVEGQEDDSVYYWVQLADAAGLFPGQKGYQDFKQISDMDDPVETESLLEHFED